MIKAIAGFLFIGWCLFQIPTFLLFCAFLGDGSRWDKDCGTPDKNYVQLFARNVVAPSLHIACFLTKPFGKED